MSDCNCKHPYGDKHACTTQEVQELAELPIYDLDNLPNFILSETDALDEATGRVLSSIVRLPINRIVPNGDLEGKFTLAANNDSLEVAEGQPLPAYVQQDGSVVRVLPADSGHKAKFLVLGKYGEGMVLCQADGVLNIVGGHGLIPGADYYLGKNGGFTTSPSETGQHLFYVLNDRKLLINLGA